MPKVTLTYGIYRKVVDVPVGTTLEDLEIMARQEWNMPGDLVVNVNQKDENGTTDSRPG